MRGSAENNKGFTIVELLIVIVVIGILAAITIVTYTSARGRAKDARIVATITQYTDILNIYRVNKGTYPVIDTGSDYKACLGDQYPAETNYPANTCAISGSIATTVNTTINNDLRTIAGQLPATKDFAN